MNCIKILIEYIKNILTTISSDPTEVGIVLQFIGEIIALLPIIGGIICCFDSKIVEFSKSTKNQAKRLLKEYNRHISTALRKESVFFLRR